MLQFRMINLLILAMTIANFALAESNTGPFEIQLSSDEISSKKLNHAIKNIPDRMAETARATKSYFDLQGEDFEGQNCFWFALSHHMPELSTKKLSIDFSNLVIEKDGIELSHIKFPGYDNFETVHRESHGPEKENEQELSFPWIMIPGVNLENEEFFIQVQNPQEIKLGDLFVVFFISSSFSI